MSEQFEVGEVAIWVKPGPNYGMEVTIIGPLQKARPRNSNTNEVVEGWYYQIDPPANAHYGPYRSKDPRRWAAPEHLRKKPPKREDLQLVRWSECPWQPEVLSV
jgi:hypothetical protein